MPRSAERSAKRRRSRTFRSFDFEGTARLRCASWLSTASTLTTAITRSLSPCCDYGGDDRDSPRATEADVDPSEGSARLPWRRQSAGVSRGTRGEHRGVPARRGPSPPGRNVSRYRLYLMTDAIRGPTASRLTSTTVNGVPSDFHTLGHRPLHQVSESLTGRESLVIDLTEWLPEGLPALEVVDHCERHKDLLGCAVRPTCSPSSTAGTAAGCSKETFAPT